MPKTSLLDTSVVRTLRKGWATAVRPVPPGAGRRLIRRLSANAKRIRQAYQTLAALAARGEPVPSETEWLLDNYYIIDAAARQSVEHLPDKYLRELPVEPTGPFAGVPRVYALAAAVVAGSDGHLTEPLLATALHDYQQTRSLTIGELWAVPIMLRLAILETLGNLSDQILATVEARRSAQQAVKARRNRKLPSPPADAYAVTVWECIREAGPPDAEFEAWSQEHLADPHAIGHREFCRQAANQVTIGNAVTTLRLLDVLDWREFFEASSHVEAILRSDPGGVYARQDFATRDRCRRRVERLARGSRRPEPDVAKSAVAAAKRGGNHVAWHLLGEGRLEFAGKLGARTPVLKRPRAWVVQHPGVLYTGCLISFALAALVPCWFWLANAPWWAAAAATLCAVLIAWDLSVAATNFLVRHLVPPRVLPKFDYDPPLLKDQATFVVIPALVSHPSQAEGLLRKIEQHALANPDPGLSFALLTDFADADTATMPEDAAILSALQAGLARLNADYKGTRFYLFHRRRHFNPAQGCWMGWERKRGKLDEFNRLLRGANDTNFTVTCGPPGDLPHVRYVLTLDADTVLPQDAAKRMIAALAHPLNVARLSKDGRRVEAGYAILQPRVSFLYRTGFRSWFARIFAGSAGVDPYSSAASDTFMDLFGRGSFTGKGLYDVDAFAATAGRAFPENRILSHDLIESNYARCALATDIEVFDEFPARYHAWARREHRWIRGDWQLLPWLGRRVPSPAGPRPNVLPALERWKVIENLRRSLLAPAALALLLLAWFALPWPAWGWTLFALAPFLIPTFWLIVDTLWPMRSMAAVRSLPGRLKFDFAPTLGQAALHATFLADQARLSLDAVGRTLYRLFISRKRMLEWEAAAASEARLGKHWLSFLLTTGPASLFAIAVAAVLAVVAPANLLIALPLLTAWFLSPAIAYAVSRPRTIAEPKLSAQETAELHRIAKQTWGFFEKYVGPEDNWLPPDNFQEDPLGEVAHRTSPTNIGLYLLAVMTAHDFEFISPRQMSQRLEKAFDSLDKLERLHGHWFNWYETSNLSTMYPPYVSTVDSGNLLACLIALKHGLLEKAEQFESETQALQALARRADAYASEMSFGFLYNAERELFAIGFNAVTGKLDPNHYDLLASEACLASYLAIARGEVPRTHWFRLGRLVTRLAGEVGLVSWGGTMFEYLMPRVLLATPPGVLLDRSQRTAVHRQRERGRELGIPWGVSESCFALLDVRQVYQYQSFGVSGLGLKRGLDRDRVIAPYATMLAIDIDASAALKNLAAIRAAGGEGPYGFYESLDYTPERALADGKPTIVKAYMAHHQGMGLLSIANRLTGGIVRRRFAREPAVRAAQLLLDERVPEEAAGMDPDGPTRTTPMEVVGPDYPMRRRISTPHTPTPRTHLLSNGRYTVMVTNAGGGYSRCGDLDVTRWHADSTTDACGQFQYVRLRRKGLVWSAGYQPTLANAESYDATFSIDKAEFVRVEDEIETRTEIAVVPDQDVEVRRITLTNRGSRPRVLDVTSYVELALATHAADLAHPAFGKLFVETEWLNDNAALLARRRPRSPEQTPDFAVHVLAEEAPAGSTSWETSREVFLGRRRIPASPAALNPTVGDLAGHAGAVLDPIFALRRSFSLEPGEKAVLAFSTGVAATREDALALAKRYRAMTAVARGFELAWAHARIEMQGNRWKPDEAFLFQRLAGYLTYPVSALRVDAAALQANRFGQSRLWAFGISGDLPILLLRMHSAAGLSHLRLLLQAHIFWRLKGQKVDLVVLLERAGGYLDELHDETVNQVRAAGLADRLDQPDGVFLRKGWQMADDDRTLLLAAARVVLDDRFGPVASQVDAASPPRSLPARRHGAAVHPARHFGTIEPPERLLFESPFGGFRKDGTEYVIHPGCVPPMPWSNVIANADAGFLVTDAGSGFTWAGNSQLNRLTPWSNDPVADPAGEAIYLFDEDSGALWNPTPGPVETSGPVQVRHGIGYSVFERRAEGIASSLTLFMAANDPVKTSLLTLTNESARVRKLEVASFAEWVLGPNREATGSHVVTEVDAATGALVARNAFNADFAGRVAFADCDLRPRTVTGDRAEFLGRNRSASLPLSFSRSGLSGAVGPGLDPCAALRASFTLAPGESRTIVFVLGQAPDRSQARALVRKYCTASAAEAALAEATAKWETLCGAVQVDTPDAGFDLLVNRWLLYQSLSCRIWGRSAFYQSGGAFGFRDQLQDCCALVHAAPAEARAHLLRAASRQFVEGDVQHWWHEPAGQGVRTRCSDDFLWLPYAVAHYVATTGDEGVLQEMVPYLDAPPLAPQQHEVYLVPGVSPRPGTLFEHCERALDCGWKLGAQGLPLMGSGDWNDGMNRVGAAGRGESVWVAWFQIDVLTRFAALADRVREASAAIRCRDHAKQLLDAVETHAWDGEWYLRAFFDDGTPLGSSANDECRLDSLAQSWAVIAGGEPGRAAQAMDAVLAKLVRDDERLVLLFAPPFDAGPLQPGYIKGYVPGVRENGGQYTHAAAWVVKALAGLGRGDDAHRLFSLVNPARAPVEKYRGEPYAIAADVYSASAHAGRAGWTWYTGSAAWLYRVALEDLLGLERRGNQLRLRPCLPKAWPGFTLAYRFGESVYRVECRRGASGIVLDGAPVDGDTVTLMDDRREHSVVVTFESNPGRK